MSNFEDDYYDDDDAVGFAPNELPPRLRELWQAYIEIDLQLSEGEIRIDEAEQKLEDAKVTDGLGQVWRINPEHDRKEDAFTVTDSKGVPLSIVSIDQYVRTDEDSDVMDAAGFDGRLEGGDYPDTIEPIVVEDEDEAQALAEERYRAEHGEEPNSKSALRIPKSISNFKEFDSGEKRKFLIVAGALLAILVMLIYLLGSCGGGSTEEKDDTPPPPPPSSASVEPTEPEEPPLGGEIPETADEGPEALRVSQFIGALSKGDSKALRGYFAEEVGEGDVYAAGLVASSLVKNKYRIVDASGGHKASPTIIHVVTKQRVPVVVAVAKIGWKKVGTKWQVTNVPVYLGKDNQAIAAVK